MQHRHNVNMQAARLEQISLEMVLKWVTVSEEALRSVSAARSCASLGRALHSRMAKRLSSAAGAARGHLLVIPV